jgi:hypothetical protein
VAWILSSMIRVALWSIPVKLMWVVVSSRTAWPDTEPHRRCTSPMQRRLITLYLKMRPSLQYSYNPPLRLVIAYIVSRALQHFLSVNDAHHQIPSHPPPCLALHPCSNGHTWILLVACPTAARYLFHSPGSIGSAAALTSNSGLGQRLMPYDDQTACSRALAPLRFCLGRPTRAIVVSNSATACAEEMSLADKDEKMNTPIWRGCGSSSVKRTFL